MKKRNITLTQIKPIVHLSNYISVKDGESWGPRSIPDFELILLVSGNYSYLRCDTGEIEYINQGEVICIPPGEKHVFKCESKSSVNSVISCIHLDLYKGSFLLHDYTLSIFPSFRTNTYSDASIYELFRNCHNTFDGFGKYRSEILSATAQELWLRLAEYWEEASEKIMSRRMRKMTSFLQNNMEKSLTRHDIAKKFNLSPEYVNALFKKEIGMSPAKFLRRIKIYQACRLLREDGLNIKETADRMGFYDEFHFSKSFKLVMGVPPSKFKGK